MTRTFGILGNPIAHSRSPAMHGAALREARLDAEFIPFDVRAEDLAEAVSGLRRLGVCGLSVTVPHKEAVVSLCDEVSDEARRLGAVNTIVVRDGVWRGENTDARGLGAVLESMGLALHGASAVLIGAGGAARAAQATLVALGVRTLHVANRSPDRARRMASYASERGCEVTVSGLDRLAIGSALRGAAVLVQASSAGMRGVDAGDWPAAIPVEALRPGAAVVDLVYAPRPSELLQRARAAGLETQDGLEMLVRQGALAFTLWTGLAAPLGAMREAVRSP